MLVVAIFQAGLSEVVLPGRREKYHVKTYELAWISEGTSIREDRVVYINGPPSDEGVPELLLAIVNKIYRAYKNKKTPESDSELLVDVSWMYHWGDITGSKRSQKYSCYEKLGGVKLPDGSREVLYTAHRDTVDLAAIRRPVKVWFVAHKSGKGRLPEVTFSMAGKVRAQPVKGFVCTRFLDTHSGSVYPLEQVRADVKAHTFEDDLIPQVTRLMSGTDAWTRDIKQKDKRIRRAHALRTSQTVKKTAGVPRMQTRGAGAKKSGDISTRESPPKVVQQPSIPAIPREKSSAHDKSSSEPKAVKAPPKTGRKVRKGSLSQSKIPSKPRTKSLARDSSGPLLAQTSSGSLVQPQTELLSKQSPQADCPPSEGSRPQEAKADMMEIEESAEATKSKVEDEATQPPVENVSHCYDSDSSMSLG